MLSFLFKLYKTIISPVLHLIGKSIFGSQYACRFTPTCSVYTSEAVKRYGIIQGIYLGFKRFLRCNPFSAGGFDPVPDKIK